MAARFAFASFLFLTGSPLSGADGSEEALQAFLKALEEGPRALAPVLGRYNRIESAKEFDVFGRHRIHQGLIRALKAMKDPALAGEAARVLNGSGREALPSQVLVLKALLDPDFPAPRKDRIEWLLGAARSKDERLALWGTRLLGDSRWAAAVDALIDLLRMEEEAKRHDSFLWHLASSEVYRLLGAEAARGDAKRIQDAWDGMKRRPPANPDHRPGGGKGITSAFFGDRISPRSVFVIDTSSSMTQATSLRRPGARTSARGSEEKDVGPRERKIEIVRAELIRALNGLQPRFRFNILAYNATVLPWRGKGGHLYDATSTAVRSAVEFAERLSTESGTNIHDALAAALEAAYVETVYLLSDGVPSRGGDAPEIERRAEALNYLKGVRVITYGFAAEGQGAYDEEFMTRLAQNHRGWYRRLN